MAKQTLAVQSIQDQLNASLAEAAPVLKNVIIGIQNILPGRYEADIHDGVHNPGLGGSEGCYVDFEYCAVV